MGPLVTFIGLFLVTLVVGAVLYGGANAIFKLWPSTPWGMIIGVAIGTATGRVLLDYVFK